MNVDITIIAQLIIKVFSVLGCIVYAIFAFVMVRQEHLMSNVLEEAFEPFLRFLVYAHLIVSLIMIALALLLL